METLYALLFFLLAAFGQPTESFRIDNVTVNNVYSHARIGPVEIWDWSDNVPYNDGAICIADAPTGITCVFPNGLVATDIDI